MTRRNPHYNLRTRPRVTYARASKEHLAEAAATSPIAFIPSPRRSTPPGAKLDPAAFPHLTFVPCTHYPGTITLASCKRQHELARRGSVGAGKAAMDAIEKNTSACRTCVDGAARCGKPPIVAKVTKVAATCRCGEPVTPPLVRCPACLLLDGTKAGHGPAIAKGREPQQVTNERRNRERCNGQ